MGGKLTAESSAGLGSTFHFTVSLGLGKEEPIVIQQRDELLKNKHILLVDDNETSRRVLVQTLNYSEMQVTTAHDGENAISLIDSAPTPFDYVLLDTQMSNADGFSVASHIKNLGKTDIFVFRF